MSKRETLLTIAAGLMFVVVVAAFVYHTKGIDQERLDCQERGGNLIVSRDGRWCVSNSSFR